MRWTDGADGAPLPESSLVVEPFTLTSIEAMRDRQRSRKEFVLNSQLVENHREGGISSREGSTAIDRAILRPCIPTPGDCALDRAARRRVHDRQAI
jgi:hypothetical protein